MTEPLTSLCRNCLASNDDDLSGQRCGKCGSPRIVRHSELHDLTIAHIDCDAFYASVEKRDNPSLADKPVIIGGGQRGVVAAACYVARLYGIRSAMPMFKAKQACPDAVVIRPNMAKYKAVGEQIRDLMREVTPLVQPLSIDEAFLDLTDVVAEGNNSAAMRLAALVLRIEQKIGVNTSIGLSYNKFLAKIASDLDKPRGFAVIGRAEACDFLAGKPVGMLWGVGRSLAGKLRRNGITKIGQLQQIEEQELVAKYGVIGSRLYHFARGNDTRKVEPNSQTKSISAETTFEIDISDATALLERIVPLCHTVARRLENKYLAGQGVTVKLKQSDFRLLTRSRRLANPTQQAEAIYRAAKWLIEREADGRTFRLIGVGVDDLTDASDADPPDLFAARGAKPAI
ncbi:MAG: DNA polymerase IV [Pseudomonadota bacterium]|nr:DNA polymerase IV [Pseudomonadota bacterium]